MYLSPSGLIQKRTYIYIRAKALRYKRQGSSNNQGGFAMLDFLRQKRRSSVIVVIFAVIILVFIFWGVYSPQGNNAPSDYVAEVDGAGISAREYNELYRRQTEYYRSVFEGK